MVAGGDASSIAYVNKRFTSAPEGVAPFPEGELPCDVVVANILLRPLLALRDTILARVRPGGALARRVLPRCGRHRLELKGSIGEGPDHSNFSDRSSVRILSQFRNFR